ncbi:MAG: hypothetical protein ACLR8Y_19365 [Alistipes indistinctus]
MVQIGPDQPRSGRPDIAFLSAGCPQFFGDCQSFRNERVDIVPFHPGTEIGIANVEVGFKDDQHPLD